MRNKRTLISACLKILMLMVLSISCFAQEADTLKEKNTMPESPSIYLINQSTFEFETIGLIGVVTEDGKFSWSMDIYAAEGKYEGHTVAPKFSFTDLKESENFKYDNLFAWSKVQAYDEKIEDWVGSFYIFDDHDFEVAITLEKKSKKLFHIIIDGKVNLNWSSETATHFKKFRIEKTLPFNGIVSEIDDEEKARAIAAKFLDVSEMNWRPKNVAKDQEDNWFTF